MASRTLKLTENHLLRLLLPEDTWIRQEKDEEIKRHIEYIFDRAPLTFKTTSPDGVEQEHVNTHPIEEQLLEESKKLHLTAFNPQHSAPTAEERLGIKVFAVAALYENSEDRFPQTMLALKHALSLNPFLSEAWYKLGSIHMMNRSPEAAVEALEKCVALSPRFLPPFPDLAAALMVLKNYHKAIQYLQKALDLDPSHLPSLYNKAVCHQSLEDWKEAIKSYELILKIHNANLRLAQNPEEHVEYRPSVNIPASVHALAQCYSAAETVEPRINGELPGAFRKMSTDMLEEYLVDEPKDERALCLLGCAYTERGLYQSARESFQSAITTNPECLDAHANLGMLLYAEGNYGSALSHLEHALSLDDSLYQLHINVGHVYRLNGSSQEAMDHYRKAIAINPKASGEAHLHLGILLFYAQDLASAKPFLDEAVKFFPESMEVHYHLALFYKLTRNAIAARTHFDVAYRLTINSMPSSQRMSFKLLDDGNYTAFASSLYRELTDTGRAEMSQTAHIARALNSASSTQGTASQLTSINAASLLNEMGRVADAIRVYQAILSASPRYVPAHFNIAKAYEATGALEKALEHLSMTVEYEPKMTEALVALGNLLAGMGDFVRAVPFLQRAVDANRYDVSAWHALADCQVELGHYRTAQQSYNHVTRLSPNEADAHVGIGVCFYHLKRFKDAEMSYRQAIELSQGQNYLAYYNLSSTLLALFRTAEALDSLRSTIRIEPGFSHAHLDYAITLFESTNSPSQEVLSEVTEHLNGALKLDPSLKERVPAAMTQYVSQ